MAKQGFEIVDLESGNRYRMETESDVLTADFNIILPEANGKLALVKDVEDLNSKLVRGDITVGDSSKLDGKDSSEFADKNLSNVILTPEVISSLRGYTGSAGATGSQGIQGPQGLVGLKGDTGYTGSKGADGSVGSQGIQGYTGSQGIQGNIGFTGSVGATGQGFKISATFNSLAELLAGTTTNDTFGLVAGTLSPDADDYGKLYYRFNNTWTYVTDMSVKGAAGIQGPQGNVGYTGSIGAQGAIGYTGSQGLTGNTGSQGIQGYTGSAGAAGDQGPQGYTGSAGIGYTGSKGDTGPMGPQGPQGPAGTGGSSSSVSDNVVELWGWPIDLTAGGYFKGDAMMLQGASPYVSGAKPSGQVTSFVLEIQNAGSYTLNWSGIGTVSWPSGSAPTLSTSGVDLIAFISTDGGYNWKGLVLGKEIR